MAIAAFLLALAVSIVGVVVVIEAREPRFKLAILIAVVGFAMESGGSILVRASATIARETSGQVAQLAEIMRARSWLFVTSVGGALAILSVALLGRRFYRRFNAAIAVLVVTGFVVGRTLTTQLPTLDDIERAELVLQLGWLAALAVVATTIIYAPRKLAYVGFQRASRAGWLLAFTSVVMLGVSLGGIPSSDHARDVFHSIATGVTLCMLLGVLGVIWGVITAQRLDEPRSARWLFGIAAVVIAVVAIGRATQLVALSTGALSNLTLYENRELVIFGLGVIAVMIGCHLVVCRHGIHELRVGFFLRLALIVLTLVVIVVLHAPSGSLGMAPSPGSILQGILRVVMCVVVARELGELSSRIHRAPELPTAKATITSANEL